MVAMVHGVPGANVTNHVEKEDVQEQGSATNLSPNVEEGLARERTTRLASARLRNAQVSLTFFINK